MSFFLASVHRGLLIWALSVSLSVDGGFLLAAPGADD